MTLHVQVSQWTRDQNINDNWVTLWSVTPQNIKGKFFQIIWKVNSNKIDIKITYNDEVCIECNLDYLSNDIKANKLENFILKEYDPHIWVFTPPEPFYVNVGSEFKLEMKADTNNKTYKLICGSTIWGQP